MKSLSKFLKFRVDSESVHEVKVSRKKIQIGTSLYKNRLTCPRCHTLRRLKNAFHDLVNFSLCVTPLFLRARSMFFFARFFFITLREAGDLRWSRVRLFFFLLSMHTLYNRKPDEHSSFNDFDPPRKRA